MFSCCAERYTIQRASNFGFERSARWHRRIAIVCAQHGHPILCKVREFILRVKVPYWQVAEAS